MKRWLPLAIILALAAGALYLGQRRKSDAPIGPQAVLGFIAGAEREVSRVPARMTRLSDEEEIALGDRLAAQYAPVTERGDLVSGDMQAYVERVGLQVASHAHRKLPYVFHYIPDSTLINAFDLPGGHVFIGAGLIVRMDSEDELAATLAHEIEHIDRYHCAERLQVQAHMRKLHLGLIGELAEIPLQVFQAGYSKEQETEADVEGARLAALEGYSPNGMVRLLRMMQTLRHDTERVPRTPQEEVSRVALGTLREYFRTHPDESDRIARLQQLISQEHWQDRTGERPLRFIITVRETRSAAE